MLSSINLDNFRNFTHAELEFDDKCNVFYGQNGSGKTSLLEAIHYLILGRSFRSHLVRRIVKYDTNNFSIFGKIDQDGTPLSVGITKSTKTNKKIKVGGNEVSSNIEITKLVPAQLLNHDSYLLLHEGPKARRQFMDWGLFHVEQSFLDLWRKVERILGQRNMALRKKLPAEFITVWDKDLARLGVELHQHRLKYIKQFIPVAGKILQDLLPDFAINLSYTPGWDAVIDLDLFLANNLKNDLQLGYTTAGPHRADIKILANKVPAKDSLSRGQQKLLLYGLQLAQGILLNELTDKRCIYLVDDLLAELDMKKCQLIARILFNLEKSQIFITGLAKDDLENIFSDNKINRKVFHIDNGRLV